MSVELNNLLKNRQPMELALAFWAPVSSVPGSMSAFLIQPLLSGKKFSATGILIVGELVLLIAQCIFQIKEVPVIDVNQGQEYCIPIGELKALLNEVSQSNRKADAFHPKGTREGVYSGLRTGVEVPTPESTGAPLAIGLSIFAPYSNEPFSSSLFLLVPLFILPGLRGTLPILILLLLDTIFVRAVIPPQATGSKPLQKDSTPP